jgi:hypothetical protein
MTTQTKKVSILKQALEAREEEIFSYQIDIDNFERAIKKIEIEYKEDVNMQDFKANLCNLLKENKAQQAKSIIIHAVIKEQLFELTGELCFTPD